MFKFDKYPELIDYHKKYLKVGDAATKTLIKVVDYKVARAENKFDKIGKNRENLIIVYAKAVFDIFIKIKPNILNRRTNSYESWDSLIGDDFNKIPRNQIIGLVILVEEDGGLYRLPPEYYE